MFTSPKVSRTACSPSGSAASRRAHSRTTGSASSGAAPAVTPSHFSISSFMIKDTRAVPRWFRWAPNPVRRACRAARQPETLARPFSMCPISRLPERVVPVDGDVQVVPAVRVGRRVDHRAAASRLDLDGPGPVPQVRLVDVAARPHREGERGPAGVAEREVQVALMGVDPRGDLGTGRGAALRGPGELPAETVRPRHREPVGLAGHGHRPLRGALDVPVLRYGELARVRVQREVRRRAPRVAEGHLHRAVHHLRLRVRLVGQRAGRAGAGLLHGHVLDGRRLRRPAAAERRDGARLFHLE